MSEEEKNEIQVDELSTEDYNKAEKMMKKMPFISKRTVFLYA